MKSPDSPVKTVFLVGAGDRGTVYTNWILRHPGQMRLAAVAEPREDRRRITGDRHGIPREARFAHWRDLLDSGQTADGVIIATGDKEHLEPSAAFLERGYHVLLEKPMALDHHIVGEIVTAAAGAEKSGGSLTVCHVLRYSPFFIKVKEIVDSGLLGEVKSIFHAENVAWYHYAHSYVRGNWGNSGASSPFILAKSSHDLDIITWLTGSIPVSLYSSGRRSVFTEAQAPPGAPARCLDGCPIEETCPYEALKTYLHGLPLKTALARAPGVLGFAGRFMVRHPRLTRLIPGLSRYGVWKEWPTSTSTSDLTPEGIRHALTEGPYGRCVYRCDNDQMEQQDTLIDFASGVKASFRLHGLSHEEGRTLRIDGTEGTLRAKFGSGSKISVTPHGPGKTLHFPVNSDYLGHGGADEGLMETWSGVLRGAPPPTGAAESAASHYLAFAAGESARTGLPVKLN